MERTYVKELLTDELGKGYELVSRIIGGMMNISYIVKDSHGNKYVLYLPNGKANKLVNRKQEKKCQKIVFDLGLTSENIYFDTKKGIKINRYRRLNLKIR